MDGGTATTGPEAPRKVLIIGIGVGDPDHMTMQAVRALNSADVIFIPDKGAEKSDLRLLRREICRRFLDGDRVRFVEFETLARRTDTGNYRQEVAAWHARIADQYGALLETEMRAGETGAFLVWGDPSLYDSTLRIIEAVAARRDPPLDYETIPGITSVQVLASRHRIALNRIGEPVRVTTGRLLADGAPDRESVVVMLDGEQAFAQVPGDDDLDIYWGAYLGSEDEILVSGRLADVKDRILRLRAEARKAKGWIMDIYLLRSRRASR